MVRIFGHLNVLILFISSLFASIIRPKISVIKVQVDPHDPNDRYIIHGTVRGDKTELCQEQKEITEVL